MIKYIVQMLVSKRDINGNIYFAFNIWNTATGQQLNGLCDNHNTAENAVWHVSDNGQGLLRLERNMSKREFNKETKNYKHFLHNEIMVQINEKRI